MKQGTLFVGVAATYFASAVFSYAQQTPANALAGQWRGEAVGYIYELDFAPGVEVKGTLKIDYVDPATKQSYSVRSNVGFHGALVGNDLTLDDDERRHYHFTLSGNILEPKMLTPAEHGQGFENVRSEVTGSHYTLRLTRVR